MQQTLIVKHNRDDTGWLVTREGDWSPLLPTVFKTELAALLAAHAAYPQAEVLLDSRTHWSIGNGMVMISGLADYQSVIFVSKRRQAHEPVDA